jgi:uncharacterized protein YdhG (YjbR/CyaY superfamily)
VEPITEAVEQFLTDEIVYDQSDETILIQFAELLDDSELSQELEELVNNR